MKFLLSSLSRIPCVHASKRQFPSVTVSDDCLSTALNKENFAGELKLFVMSDELGEAEFWQFGFSIFENVFFVCEFCVVIISNISPHREYEIKL